MSLDAEDTPAERKPPRGTPASERQGVKQRLDGRLLSVPECRLPTERLKLERLRSLVRRVVHNAPCRRECSKRGAGAHRFARRVEREHVASSKPTHRRLLAMTELAEPSPNRRKNVVVARDADPVTSLDGVTCRPGSALTRHWQRPLRAGRSRRGRTHWLTLPPSSCEPEPQATCSSPRSRPSTAIARS